MVRSIWVKIDLTKTAMEFRFTSMEYLIGLVNYAVCQQAFEIKKPYYGHHPMCSQCRPKTSLKGLRVMKANHDRLPSVESLPTQPGSLIPWERLKYPFDSVFTEGFWKLENSKCYTNLTHQEILNFRDSPKIHCLLPSCREPGWRPMGFHHQTSR